MPAGSPGLPFEETVEGLRIVRAPIVLRDGHPRPATQRAARDRPAARCGRRRRGAAPAPARPASVAGARRSPSTPRAADGRPHAPPRGPPPRAPRRSRRILAPRRDQDRPPALPRRARPRRPVRPLPAPADGLGGSPRGRRRAGGPLARDVGGLAPRPGAAPPAVRRPDDLRQPRRLPPRPGLRSDAARHAPPLRPPRAALGPGGGPRGHRQRRVRGHPRPAARHSPPARRPQLPGSLRPARDASRPDPRPRGDRARDGDRPLPGRPDDRARRGAGDGGDPRGAGGPLCRHGVREPARRVRRARRAGPVPRPRLGHRPGPARGAARVDRVCRRHAHGDPADDAQPPLHDPAEAVGGDRRGGSGRGVGPAGDGRGRPRGGLRDAVRRDGSGLDRCGDQGAPRALRRRARGDAGTHAGRRPRPLQLARPGRGAPRGVRRARRRSARRHDRDAPRSLAPSSTSSGRARTSSRRRP